MHKKNKTIIYKMDHNLTAMSFKTITLIIFSIILIGSLIYVYFSIEKTVSRVEWPPSVSKCPDYWEEERDDENKPFCVNRKEIGLPVAICQDDLDSEFLAKDKCAKSLWARSCDLTWDGVTNKENVCR